MLKIRNRLASFKVADIHLPDPAEVLTTLHGGDILQGRVLDLTDSGRQKDAFAVLEVQGIEGHVIVPMNSILSFT